VSAEQADATLLAQCDVQTYRGSGPGGQNRNKVESAVRIVHRPTGTTVTATESRSQAENRARALRRLRRALALRVRRPLEVEGVPEPVTAVIAGDGRLRVGKRDRRYLPAAAAILDALVAHKGSVSATAGRLRITTGNLSAFLTRDDDVMAAVNRIRAEFGLRPLRR